MPVPTQASDAKKWSKPQEVKGLAWQMETLSAMLLDAKLGWVYQKVGIRTPTTPQIAGTLMRTYGISE
jgi:hypothetical protein